MKAIRLYFLLITLLVLSAGGIVGTFAWGRNQLEANSNTVSSLLAERDAQRDNIIILQQAEAQLAEAEYANSLLEKLLPKEKNQEALVLDIIYTATAESKIPISNITSFSFSGSDGPSALSGTIPLKEIPGVSEYPFNLELKNISYTALLTLLSEVEKNGRIIQIDVVQITPSKTSSGLLTSVNLSMKAYVLP
jgi:Tfp pilus assembly protein PilO